MTLITFYSKENNQTLQHLTMYENIETLKLMEQDLLKKGYEAVEFHSVHINPKDLFLQITHRQH